MWFSRGPELYFQYYNPPGKHILNCTFEVAVGFLSVSWIQTASQQHEYFIMHGLAWALSQGPNHDVCLTRRSRFDPDGMSCVVLWRPEALDCRALIPPETWN